MAVETIQKSCNSVFQIGAVWLKKAEGDANSQSDLVDEDTVCKAHDMQCWRNARREATSYISFCTICFILVAKNKT